MLKKIYGAFKCLLFTRLNSYQPFHHVQRLHELSFSASVFDGFQYWNIIHSIYKSMPHDFSLHYHEV